MSARLHGAALALLAVVAPFASAPVQANGARSDAARNHVTGRYFIASLLDGRAPTPAEREHRH